MQEQYYTPFLLMTSIAIHRNDLAPGIATLQLRRPRYKNALGPEDLGHLRVCLADCQADPEVRAIVITGDGDAFCAGADIHAINRLSGSALDAYLEGWTELLLRIVGMPKIVVAAVNGASAGAGNHIALCSDFCIASSQAVFHFTGSAKGIPSLELGALLLPMTVGLKRAKQLLLMGARLPAGEAAEVGLCNAVIPAEAWRQGLAAWCQPLAGKHAAATAHTKYVLNQAAYQLTGPLKLSTLAGSAYLSGVSNLVAGRAE